MESEVFYYLGIAYFYSPNHVESHAKPTFLKYRGLKKIKYPEQVEDYIRKCDHAIELIKSPLNVNYINLGKNINSSKDDFNPVVADDESMLVFSSVSAKTGYTNVYYSVKSLFGTLNKRKSVGKTINTTKDEIVAGMSKDGDQLFIHYNDYSPLQDINVSHIDGVKFGVLESVGENINTKTFREEGVSITVDKDTLFFASDQEGGVGGFDIYMSIKLPNGKWGKPINLGETINTPSDENYPNISRDGQRLYFSSKGHRGIGGYDLFSSKFDHQTGQWSAPKNLGFPINDAYDNKAISFSYNGRYAYTAAIKEGGYGGYDIYNAVFHEVEPDYVMYRGVIAVGDSLHRENVAEIDPEISITVYFKVTGEIQGVYSYNRTNSKYVISLPPGEYILTVSGAAYTTYKKEIKVEEAHHNTLEVTQNIYLQKGEQ